MLNAVFNLTPKRMFLIDGIGALLTASFLALILPHFQEQIGIPTDTLILMGAAGALYSIYSLSCFYFLRQDYAIWLKIIILANLLYCVASAGIVTVYVEQITLLGFVYFALEVCVILAVVALELFVLKSHLFAREALNANQSSK